VRVIAATNKDLLELSHKGRFREDLYYRLNTVPIRVPALRDRKDDILLLFRKFTADFADRYKIASVQLTDDAKQMLLEYPWPGNVRELKNIAEQISVLSKEKLINGETLRQFLPEQTYAGLPVLAGAPSGTVSQAEFANEREIIYKLFFDMKKDVNELKKLLFEVINTVGLNPQSSGSNYFSHPPAMDYDDLVEPTVYGPNKVSNASIVYKPSPNDNIQQPVEVDESLNIMDKEKELIIKALKKHRGKRRDASIDLGISERTLYRKLKEYDIENL
jgi:DNA-binding NtrC family response regulator